MDKMISSGGDQAPHEAIIITNVGATILLQPAACMLANFSRSKDTAAEDGTTTVVVLAGSLLRRTQSLLSARSLLHCAQLPLPARRRRPPRRRQSDSPGPPRYPRWGWRVRHSGQRGCGLDILGRRGVWCGSSWARPGKLRCVAWSLMLSAATSCARAAISAVAKVPSKISVVVREGDEDGNRDREQIRHEEDRKGDWSGMVPILEISSGM
uniref:Uncharacterized protein n=1 Tax=Oryza meridionalis TaxID=40149 RepID=A0A0E0DD76_9ORYZ